MGAGLIGVAALLIIIWYMHKYVQANPRRMASLLQKAGGIAAIIAAFFLSIRGELVVGLPLALMGLGLLGWINAGALGSWWPWGAAGAGQASAQAMRFRSPFLDVEIDPATGAMQGRVVAGRAAGADLDTLDDASLMSLMAEFDAESRKLLQAYLDRRRAGRREDAHGGADARERRSAGTGKMSEEEAYQVLGLEPGAGADEIGQAYRTLMKKLHPDQGGSTYLATRINEAKEVLLRRHR